MKELTWGEYKKMRDDSFKLESEAYRRVTGRPLADTARSLNPDSFDFDEWEMPENADLYDKELIEGLAEYLAVTLYYSDQENLATEGYNYLVYRGAERG